MTSDLMYHAMARLKPMGIRAGIVDLQPLGSYGDMNVWFGGVVYSIGQSLGLETDAAAWWNEHALLVPTQRFMTFMEEVVLREVLGRVVIFPFPPFVTLFCGYAMQYYECVAVVL